MGLFTTSKLADWSVNGAKIVDYAVTDTKIKSNAVTTAKIADGAVTDTKITGPISVSKLEKPANVVVVAQSGGDFTTISGALAAKMDSDPTPLLIKVMPGIYVENITMKSNVHLQGSGYNITKIQSPSIQSDVILLNSLINVTISDISISGGYYGIHNISSSPQINGNLINLNNVGGIYNEAASSPIITGNTINANGFSGINNANSSPTIMLNTISVNNFWGVVNGESSPIIRANNITENSAIGIYSSYSSSPKISENTITRNGVGVDIAAGGSPTIIGNIIIENQQYGVAIAVSSFPTIMQNRITGNGGTTFTDIAVDYTSLPHISFNIYDSISEFVTNDGPRGVIYTKGMYNLKSDATPAPISLQ